MRLFNNIQLRHILGKLLSAEDVEVKMQNALAGIGTAVGNDTVSVGKAGELCNVGDLFKDPCDVSAV